MTETGFLLIADVTGYTMFLTRSELEHAQGILDALFKSIFAEIKAPIILSNLQGDAALAYLPDAKLPQRQFPLDAIERIYCSFASTLGAMRLNTTCGTAAAKKSGRSIASAARCVTSAYALMPVVFVTAFFISRCTRITSGPCNSLRPAISCMT